MAIAIPGKDLLRYFCVYLLHFFLEICLSAKLRVMNLFYLFVCMETGVSAKLLAFGLPIHNVCYFENNPVNSQVSLSSAKLMKDWQLQSKRLRYPPQSDT